MAVTVVRPTQSNGLGQLAQILGVYIGYQRMKTGRSAEFRKQNRLADAGEELGKGSPYGEKGASKPGLIDSLQTQKAGDIERATAEGPGLSLFPRGRPEFLRGDTTPPAQRQTPVPPQARVDTPIQGKPGEFITNVSLAPSVVPRDRVAGRKVTQALNNTNVKQSHNVIEANLPKMTPEGREAAKANTDYKENATIDDYVKAAGVDRLGIPGSFHKVTKALAMNVNKGLLKYHGNDAMQRHILEQASIQKSQLNEFSSKNLNSYADRLRDRYGIHGRKISKARPSGRGPSQFFWKDKKTGEEYKVPAYNQQQAFKLIRKEGGNVPRYSAITEIGKGGSFFEQGNVYKGQAADQSSFDKSVARNPLIVPSAGIRMFRKTKGTIVPYFDSTSDTWVQLSNDEYLSALEQEHNFATGLDNRNQNVFKQLFKFDYEDYADDRTSDESLAGYAKRKKHSLPSVYAEEQSIEDRYK